MNMKFVHESRFVLLQPQGQLDAQAGMNLKQQVLAIESDRFNLCIVDLAQVDFIDSAGLLSLVSGLNAANRKNCRLVFCNLRPSVRLIFEITQLDSVFELFDTFSEATAGILQGSEQMSWPTAEPVAA